MKKFLTLALLAVVFTGGAQAAFAGPTLCKKVDKHVICTEPRPGRM